MERMAGRVAEDGLFDAFAEVAKADASGRRAGCGEVLVLDVRPEPEYHAGHIAGARSMLVSEVRRRLRSRPIDGYPEWKRAGLPVAAGRDG